MIAFFLLRAFVAEVFYIPSDSMVPTLLQKDRVLVFKPGGKTMPERWRIVTFTRRDATSGNDVTYVKRVAGLGGERIAIVGGDVYADGRLARKPDDVREVLRFPYARWDFGEPAAEGWARLEEGDGTTRWRYAGETLWSAGALRSRGAGSDVPLRDVYADLEADRAAGEEVLLALAYVPAGDPEGAAAVVTWVLGADDRGIRLEKRSAGGSEATPPASAGAPPAAGRLRLRLSHVDGAVRAEAGDFAFEVPEGGVPEGLVVRPEIEVRGRSSRPSVLLLDMDLHYSLAGNLGVPSALGDDDPKSYAFEVPEGQVFVLGDNTHDSRDSRFRTLGPVPVESLVGPVVFRVWPPGRVGVVR